ncbi:MAG: preprotein translocase subunit SecY [Lentisphaerae bacterium RIFOXYC12_FULL_60_16]|nr:MAG: preprotein translocase subunit SecY [Lentisphaerae bacterium RIFOXYC12_FULL_60_16]OGV72571.1 MAG: preprotein translocase subunit SecY [Lentisphaerae bacterium RIFOXYA12_FULL_60_10]OGV77308.1 MAG: preprotein translocase subunit SecY [Lentisphaerae bacterium RIFOXYB12_FULL_60_10]
MLSAFVNSFKIPELRKRILFTLGLIFICRIVTTVPTPGVDAQALRAVISDIESQVGGGFLGWVDLFSGGALSNCAVGALSIWPYISASIILQLMTAIFPFLERLAREGESGRQRLNQYTRYLTLVICGVQALFLAVSLESPENLGITRVIVSDPGWGFRLMTVLTMTTGTMLMMWLGDQISERGIGNGISIVIMVNIVSRLPNAVFAAYNMFSKVDGVAQFSIFHLIGLVVMIFLVTAGTIALTQGQRHIPIHTTKRVVGRKVFGGQNTYMPLRVNYSGVMPIIFAGAMIAFPAVLLKKIPLVFFQRLGTAFSVGEPLYLFGEAVLIMFFSYFWVATQFNPLQIADDLKRNGGYVPGIRPGRPTAEFLDKTMTRITLIGAIFLTIIAVIPMVMATQFRVPWLVASFMGGTSLLIIVGVGLDTMRQVESQLLMRHYDGFLRKGRIRGRR